MSVPPVLSTKEVLLEHLYAVISPLVPGHADKIVGMLADSSDTQLMAVLGSQQLLKRTINDALNAIKQPEAPSVVSCGSSSESLGDELFQKVSEVEPELCAQITGMLLELDSSVIRCLLDDRSALIGAVTRAREEYTTQRHRDTNIPDHLAGRLYEAVSEIYEKNTPKITGMLADLPSEEITKLLQSPTEFKQTVELCRKALENTQQWIREA